MIGLPLFWTPCLFNFHYWLLFWAQYPACIDAIARLELKRGGAASLLDSNDVTERGLHSRCTKCNDASITATVSIIVSLRGGPLPWAFVYMPPK